MLQKILRVYFKKTNQHTGSIIPLLFEQLGSNTSVQMTERSGMQLLFLFLLMV